jgi:hypothetical protein
MDGTSVVVTGDPDHNAASVPGRWKRRRYDTNQETSLGTTMSIVAVREASVR